ncbi:hypothetical protein MICRO80W_270025 [Micrococcus luteus]|nr:hypothetical protein MICRO80W_270025 [Micrococcus luteus]
MGPARADRQLQPRGRLGHVAGVPQARGRGPDDVRPDDRRLVDLHRHPGHPAGHLRDLRRDRPQALRRLPPGHPHPHRRLRRHGRRPAPGRHPQRRRLPDRGRLGGPPAPSHGQALPGRGGDGHRQGRRARHAGQARRRGRLRGPRGQRRRGVPRAARAPEGRHRRDRHRHRPDLRARPAVLPADRDRREGLARRGRGRPGHLHQEGPGVHGPPGRGHGRLPGHRRRGVRLRQLHPRRGPQGRLLPRVRVPGLRPGLHPPAVLRGPRPVPLGRALRRPGGHPRDRRGPEGAVPRERAPAPLARRRRRVRGVRGPAGPHLLAGLRRAPQGRPALQPARGRGQGQGADRDRPRPPRLRLRGLPVPRDRVHAGRLRRDRRLAAAERPDRHLLRRHLGVDPPRRRRRHRPVHPRRPGGRCRRHRAGRGQARGAAHQRPRHGRHPPRRRRLLPRRRGRRRARRPCAHGGHDPGLTPVTSSDGDGAAAPSPSDGFTAASRTGGRPSGSRSKGHHDGLVPPRRPRAAHRHHRDGRDRGRRAPPAGALAHDRLLGDRHRHVLRARHDQRGELHPAGPPGDLGARAARPGRPLGGHGHHRRRRRVPVRLGPLAHQHHPDGLRLPRRARPGRLGDGRVRRGPELDPGREHRPVPDGQARGARGPDRPHRRRLPGPRDRLRPHGVRGRLPAPGHAADLARARPRRRRRRRLLRGLLRPGPAADEPHVHRRPLHGPRGGDHRRRLLHGVRDLHGDRGQDAGPDGHLALVLLRHPRGDVRGHRHHGAHPAAEPHPGRVLPGRHPLARAGRHPGPLPRGPARRRADPRRGPVPAEEHLGQLPGRPRDGAPDPALHHVRGPDRPGPGHLHARVRVDRRDLLPAVLGARLLRPRPAGLGLRHLDRRDVHPGHDGGRSRGPRRPVRDRRRLRLRDHLLLRGGSCHPGHGHPREDVAPPGDLGRARGAHHRAGHAAGPPGGRAHLRPTPPPHPARREALQVWVNHYNYHRPHTSCGDAPPASLAPVRVNNVMPSYN